MSLQMTTESFSEKPPAYDRIEELKAFDETKAGVKGLVDAGAVTIPRMFIRPPEELSEEHKFEAQTEIQVPVIDLSDFEKADEHEKIVDEIKVASEKWGFFQVINHGIPLDVLDEMIEGVRGFHEQDIEVKKLFYSRDMMKKVRLISNFDLYKQRSADWRDTLAISLLASDHIEPDELPESCREATVEYIKCIRELGHTLFEALSESLGLKADQLESIGCAKGCNIVCHYYPACPQPELTLGTSKHSDPGFLTLLLQDQIGGLQVFHEGQWADVRPVPGALVVNIADLLQMMSNGKFRSVEHSVRAKHIGPRISVGCFFAGHLSFWNKAYGPLNELISEEDPPRYKEVVLRDYLTYYASGSMSALEYYKL